MEVALIPPYSQLQYLKKRHYQMMLPACLTSQTYRETFLSVQVGENHVLMDNGMFESDKSLTYTSLIDLTDKWLPNELVMPDVRCDMEGTLSATSDFATKFMHCSAFETTDLMCVIQIKDFEDIPRFLAQMLTIQKYVYPSGIRKFTIGIPRRLTETLGGMARISVVSWIQSLGLDNPIHLLGYSRASATSAADEIKALWNQVRSIDTDAPFVWTWRGLELGHSQQAPERPNDYMDIPTWELDQSRLQYNIYLLDRWAQGNA